MATKIEVAIGPNGLPIVKNLKAAPPRNEEVHAYIVNKSKELGIEPRVALEVWAREGKAGWQSNFVKNGKRERSYGPFQLYTDGGLGNKFQRQTGLDPADPANWKAGVDFALEEAKTGGWGPWYGAKAAGITGFEGIGGNPASFRSGGSYSPSSPVSQSQSTPAQTGIVPKPDLGTRYRWGGTSEAVVPSNWRQMSPSFASERMGVPQSPPGDPSAGPDLTGITAPLGGLIEQFAAPNPERLAGDVVDFPGGVPKDWTLEEIRKLAKEYGAPVPEIIRILRGMQSEYGR